MLLLFRLKNFCIFVSESYWWTIKTFNSKIHNKTKKEFLLKTQNPTCWDYALKSDDDSKNRTKPISRNYAVKSDNDPKTNKPISLSMLLKAIMTQKPNLWNQTNHLSVFLVRWPRKILNPEIAGSNWHFKMLTFTDYEKLVACESLFFN